MNISVCDFGSSKVIDDTNILNVPRIVARIYRPPELVFAHSCYDTSVDMWSIGCIILELFLLKPAFEGKTDGHMFFEFCQLLGTPSKAICKELMEGLPQDLVTKLMSYVNENKIE